MNLTIVLLKYTNVHTKHNVVLLGFVEALFRYPDKWTMGTSHWTRVRYRLQQCRLYRPKTSGCTPQWWRMLYSDLQPWYWRKLGNPAAHKATCARMWVTEWDAPTSNQRYTPISQPSWASPGAHPAVQPAMQCYALNGPIPVSYTHLDVYKRQIQGYVRN